MRLIPVAAAVAALLVPAAPAFAGDPTMPLWQVHAGMQCTGYSVIQGTTISSFDVAVLDVAGGEAASGVGRILVQVSGPAVDSTGVGPGFSGSPIYCPDEAGTQRVIGAISESINEYAGKAALATPIEAIIGTPVDVPGRANEAASSTKATTSLSPRMKAALASAKPIQSPLSVSGLSKTVADGLTAASAKAGRPVLAVPPGPLGTFPAQVLRPGSAVAVGYSTGDVRTQLDRHRVLRGRRQGVGVRPSARGRRQARAAAAGRLRVPDREQPAAARIDRRDVQARLLRP